MWNLMRIATLTGLTNLLDFEFVRTFIEYEVREVDGKRIIDIRNVRPPTAEPFVPSPAELRGVSFKCPADCPIEVLLGGKPVGKEHLVFHRSAGSLIVQFPLATVPKLIVGRPE